jgi:hypothetical protein
MRKSYVYILIISISIGLFACSGRKKIEPVQETESETEGDLFNMIIIDEENSKSPDFSDWTLAKIQEVLNTKRYSYLRVKAKDEEYWIATSRKEFLEGGEIQFRGGLLKSGFKSNEYDRVFDRLYLVSEIMVGNNALDKTETQTDNLSADAEAINPPNLEGVVKIAAIVENPSAYANKEIKVYGEVVKVNPNIMNRNWIHIQDGSADEYDFVLTSDAAVPVGHSVLFEGVLATNKDFGAGYSYSIILEDAKISK